MIYLLVSPLLYICILSHNCVVSLRVLPPESRKEGVKITPVNLHTHWRDSISSLSTKESPVPVFCKVRAAVHIFYRKPVPKCTEKKNREEIQFGAPKYDYLWDALVHGIQLRSFHTARYGLRSTDSSEDLKFSVKTMILLLFPTVMV